MAELVETYLDLPLGMVDAAVIAIAERLRLTEIATLDRRHFAVGRPSHTPAFIPQRPTDRSQSRLLYMNSARSGAAAVIGSYAEASPRNCFS